MTSIADRDGAVLVLDSPHRLKLELQSEPEGSRVGLRTGDSTEGATGG
jgi:hypothetical protein